ncbi:polyprenyl diphosphate synthase [Methyloversatilis sp.]|uniref:polyprenyl diphosphate synthase n=1 Tax=Methyloversatilis sp. TaxID=2569862 RepID=UPI0027342623|nr:polyprenyl diphosphate synthase [Methyloversatilis sp.]MDP2868644.1 polyprenyl diphosphate synthase [Methyloversatilis sp.]MDP3287058.1 polyprenyl diphosphate synthase [Methyloversatilis sp.]MDP3455607.1 polyprenyl diphosphate synthase [Methyloversatilis sp.]MDP3577468.1 polyprenyl diphosphate synthase [Methyloversatilis sp.]
MSSRSSKPVDGGNLPVPQHIAIIMDGNGRWARRRFMPRVAGHRKGVEAVRAVVSRCAERGVGYLTLFAFSSENWRRPPEEVSFLMQLFMRALEEEVVRLHENSIRLRVIGDLSRFEPRLIDMIRSAETLTAGNTGLNLTVAANYGGRWDILQATECMLKANPLRREGFVESDLSPHLAMAYAPEPDLFIRTGGEQRISNFLLWQLAYTELYFTDKLWPEFNGSAVDEAIASFQQRERRFGRTSEQVQAATAAALGAVGRHA